MQKFDVQIALEGVHEARVKWAAAQTEFTRNVDFLMKRLLHEASVNYMSAEEVARHSGIPIKRIRTLMRQHGLNPRDGKRMLADHAAKTLASNAELLGVEPHEIDLMSPLAYLPAGTEIKKFLETKTISQVTDLPDEL